MPPHVEQVDVEGMDGSDSKGGKYDTVEHMWQTELAEVDEGTGQNKWYRKGVDYWAAIPATIDGVLGGFGHVTDADCSASAGFIKRCLAKPLAEAAAGTRRLTALDCGAGVGRITDQFLLHAFHEVDLLEPLRHFVDRAEAELGPSAAPKPAHVGRVKHFFCEPMEGWQPEAGRYDVIWIQWAIGHLTDEDFVRFFADCEKGLKPDGIVVVKENNCSMGFLVDKDDSSVTRSDKYFRELFKRCNYELFLVEQQKGFPKELFPVRMYALRPLQKRHRK